MYCALKALVGKPTKTEILSSYVHIQNKQCRNCKWITFAGFCVLLRIICVLLQVFCVRFCLWFGAFGDQHTTIFLPYDGKITVCFCHWGQVSGTMPEWWGGWAGTISYNRFCVCISDTQRSSTGKLDGLNDDQKFLPHVISKRLIQMCQSGMFARFARCLCRFTFTVPTGLFFCYVWRPRIIICFMWYGGRVLGGRTMPRKMNWTPSPSHLGKQMSGKREPRHKGLENTKRTDEFWPRLWKVNVILGSFPGDSLCFSDICISLVLCVSRGVQGLMDTTHLLWGYDVKW